MTASIFTAMRIRNFFAWMLVGVVCFFMIMNTLAAVVPVDEVTYGSLFGIFLSVFPLLWIIGKLEGRVVALRVFFRRMHRLPRADSIRVFLCLFLTMALSIAGSLLLSLFVPGYREFAYIKTFYSVLDTPYPLLNNLITVLLFTVLAPVIEEIFFRGVLLHRWAHRWNLRKAVVFSSIFFAVLHMEPFGSFLFGILMSILYVRTGSLVAPITLHMLNNVLVLPATMGEMSPSYVPVATTPTEEWQALAVFAILAAVLAVPSAQFLRRNWHLLSKQSSLPSA